MSLIVSLLVVTLVSQCWSAPQVGRSGFFSSEMIKMNLNIILRQNCFFIFCQRRNWTPQAILYLKGARKN